MIVLIVFVKLMMRLTYWEMNEHYIIIHQTKFVVVCLIGYSDHTF